MLSASTPAKLLLFGEWAVTKDGPAVATTINKRFLASYNPLDFNQARDKPYLNLKNKLDNFRWHGQIVPLSHFFYTATQCLQAMDYQHLLPGEIFYHCEWQIQEGLGSSSACFLSTFLLAAHNLKKNLSRDQLFSQISQLYKQHIHSKASGVDIAVQISGKSICFHQGQIQKLALAFPPNLLVVHTGLKQSTNQALDTIKPSPKLLQQIASSTRDFLQNRNWQQAMDEHHQALCELGVVPRTIYKTLQFWKKQDLITAAKTTGAGGGDALLLLANPEKIHTLKSQIRALEWWLQEAPFEAPGAVLHEINKHESRSFT